ncbi:MAG: hypothetical protein ABR604_00685, partial [Jatrophihabitantaceae bacterium]
MSSSRCGIRLALSGALAATSFVTLAATAGGAAASGAQQTYVVLYQAGASSAAAQAVQRLGGTVVANYSQIGVVVARSASAGFAGSIRSASGIQGAAATGAYGVGLSPSQTDEGPLPGSAPATDSDTLSGLQWDMRQIHTPEAHAITGGSRAVVVGDIDTGLDFTHPDLAPNYDASRSTDCSSGTP